MLNIFTCSVAWRGIWRAALVAGLMVVSVAGAGTDVRAQAVGFTDMNVSFPDPPKPEPVVEVKQPAVVNLRGRGRAGARRDVLQLVAPTAYVSTRAVNGNWSTGDAQVDGIIRESAARNRIDPYLIYCLMHQESSFKPRAISPKGARGLMQLMPGTAARFGVTNIYDVRQNIEGGTRYLRFLINSFGDDRLDLVLAGYNAGEGAVMKYSYNVPPYNETQNYVRVILGRYGTILHRVNVVGEMAKSAPSGPSAAAIAPVGGVQ